MKGKDGKIVIPDHVKVKDIHYVNMSVGQNIGYTGNNTRFFDKLSVLITNWYDEVVDFPNYMVKNYRPTEFPVIGHYTAIVWGNTTKVGCGLVRHFTKSSMYRTHLVCNYGPRGNWVDDPVYQTNNE
ncbi:hypothetical protein G9C98_006952 [Cotesia typhae]|uniref:SCP domain-containing protein n=1 Tax=Cotesia typhae TaxID=2053667 RepID=A0A8J5UXD3_9HYME|nr:hypothetical protein G9C98_006952 [Cotesia typhae]